MTNDELISFIKTVYYTYDRVLVPKDIKEYASAWGPYVGEFDYDTAQNVLPNICLGRDFPPRPWEIRVGIMNHLQTIDQPPSSPQAWAQYQVMMSDIANGTQSEHNIHPALHATLRAVQGGTLNNQFDAKRFDTLYEDKVKQWFKNIYWIGTKQ